MKLTLIGATGFIGSKVLEEALDRGYQITAVLRDPSKLTVEHKNLKKVKADIFDKEILTKIISETDGVLNSYNPGWTDPNIRENVIKGSLSIIEATKKSGVKRFLIMGGAGSLEVAPDLQLLDTPEFPKEYFHAADAVREVLKFLKTEKELEWSFLSPSAVIDPTMAKTGNYRTETNSLLVDSEGKSQISLGDLAKAFVDEVEERKHIRERFTVGY